MPYVASWSGRAAMLVVFLSVPSMVTAEETSLRLFQYAQRHMGVDFRISLYAGNEALANQASEAAFQRIKVLDSIMSDYDSTSELMRLSKSSGSRQALRISPELQYVLCRSIDLSQRTNGAFDVTVGPYVRLWRRARRQKRLPDSDRLAEAEESVGWRLLHLHSGNCTVSLAKPNMRLDLGGIAKGYAADQALDVIRRNGISRAMIDASGDIVMGAPPPGRPGWQIGIAPLESPDSSPSRMLSLHNCAVATSGDAFQYVEIDGVRYSHLVDPATGIGLTGRSSVTVVATDGITADSLASAVSVLGPERGLEFIERHCDAETLIVVADKNRKTPVESSGLSRLYSPQLKTEH